MLGIAFAEFNMEQSVILGNSVSAAFYFKCQSLAAINTILVYPSRDAMNQFFTITNSNGFDRIVETQGNYGISGYFTT